MQKVYGVLGDEEKRKVYDETGRTEDAELSGDSFKNLYEYYRGVYRAVTRMTWMRARTYRERGGAR